MSENNKKNNSSDSTENDIVFYHNTPKNDSYVPQRNKQNEPPKKTPQKNNLQNQEPQSKKQTLKPIRKKNKLTKKQLILSVCSCILGVIMICCGTLCMVAYSYLDRINYQALENSLTESSVSSKNEEVSQNGVNSSNAEFPVEKYEGELLNDPMVLNIMLFGSDRRSKDVNGNSDTMMILSIDTRHNKIKLLSLQRDTYVAIPGYISHKLNAAYSFGGASLSIQTIENNYGIHIDRYAIVDFESFEKMIDALDGIDMELTSEEIDYINWQCWKNHQVETRDEIDRSQLDFQDNENGEAVAKVHLNSRQALWHARNRGEDGICSGDDFMRTQRQRNVINTVIKEMKQADLKTILSIIYEIGPLITTNLKTSEITSLATNIMKYLKYEIVSQSLPEQQNVGVDYTNEKIYIEGRLLDCLYITDWSEMRKKVAEFIYEDSVRISEETTSD